MSVFVLLRVSALTTWTSLARFRVRVYHPLGILVSVNALVSFSFVGCTLGRRRGYMLGLIVFDALDLLYVLIRVPNTLRTQAQKPRAASPKP